MKQASISMLNIGSELLRGRTVNTNAADGAILLCNHNYYLSETIAIHDVESEIIRALEDLISRNEVVIVTGGLGPTRDDLTKKVLGKYFHSNDFVLHQPTLEMLESWVKARNRTLNEKMKEQAMVPDVCKVIPNKVGTSPGMLFEQNGKMIFSLPGVPSEMKWLMENGVIDEIKKRYMPSPILLKIVRCFGIPESDIAHRIDELGEAVSSKVQIAYLPHDGEVKIELRAAPEFSAELESTFASIRKLLSKFIFSFDSSPIEKIFGEVMRETGMKVACAESCSGGAVARLITSVSGSSQYFLGSAVTYSAESKATLLGIDKNFIIKHGVVSEEVAKAMAQASRKIFGADISVAVTGTAEIIEGDPDYGSRGIWFAIATEKETTAREIIFPQDRNSNIRRAAITALHLLLLHIRPGV